MKSKLLWVGLGLSALVLIFKLMSSQPSPELKDEQKSFTHSETNLNSPAEGKSLSPHSIAPVEPPIPSQSVIKNPGLKSLEVEAPNLDQMRKEVALNPHQTPPSVLKFAADLGEKMQLAQQSESEAKKLLPELEKCALDIPPSTYASTPRILCFSNVAELASQYPGFAQNFETLKRSLDPDTLKRFNQFQKALEKHDGTSAH